jgi:hypothetical protein
VPVLDRDLEEVLVTNPDYERGGKWHFEDIEKIEDENEMRRAKTAFRQRKKRQRDQVTRQALVE